MISITIVDDDPGVADSHQGHRLEKQVELRMQELTAINQELRALNEEQANKLVLLKAMQRQLIESEKMAALTNLVAGVAHEINTPVGVSVTAASHLLDMIHKFRRLAATGSLTRTSMCEFWDSAEESSQMILHMLARTAHLVHSFKQVSVEHSRDVKRRFLLKTCLEDIIHSMHSTLKETKHNVTIDCPADLALNSFPGAFAQIATNLLLNSLIHAYVPGDSGQIRFSLCQQNNQLFFCYSDDGKGIERKLLSKIFDPFFTTRRGDGSTGLGLHVVYNLVTQKLCGNIECQSQLGQGVCFKIRIPVDMS